VPTQEKVDTIEDFKTRLDGAKTVLVTEYRGLTVQQLSDLRKQLRGVSASYKIIKNRLAKLAMTDSDLSKLGPHLKGPTGMVISKEDPVAVAKALHTFARTNQALAIKAGFIEGQVLPPQLDRHGVLVCPLVQAGTECAVHLNRAPDDAFGQVVEVVVHA